MNCWLASPSTGEGTDGNAGPVLSCAPSVAHPEPLAGATASLTDEAENTAHGAADRRGAQAVTERRVARPEPTPDAMQRLLDSIDGVALILDANLTILQIGRPNWLRFMHHNRAADDAGARNMIGATIGRSIMVFMVGDTIRQTYSAIFRRILDGRRAVVRIDYRCDAPDLQRNMRLSVTPMVGAAGDPQLLYQSVTLSTQARAALPLFDAPVVEADGPDILTLCAICARVAWPVGAPSGQRAWIDPVDYYRRGGSEVPRISHGFCEACFARLSDEA